MSVCLFVSNKRQNGWTNRGQIFCGTSRNPREDLWMIKISNICLHQNSIFIKFLKILKIHEIFCENLRIIFVLFYDVHKENMFTINLEDGREAPYKACIYILCLSFLVFVCFFVCFFPINVKTAELIGPKCCVGPYVTPGKVYEWLNFKNLCLKVFFVKFWKCAKNVYEIRKLFCF